MYYTYYFFTGVKRTDISGVKNYGVSAHSALTGANNSGQTHKNNSIGKSSDSIVSYHQVKGIYVSALPEIVDDATIIRMDR